MIGAIAGFSISTVWKQDEIDWFMEAYDGWNKQVLVPFLYYYHSQLKGKEFVVGQTRRRIGELFLHSNMTHWKWNTNTTTTYYDAVMEASCYCNTTNDNGLHNFPHLEWLHDDASRVCIFHERCTAAPSHQAVFLSPHHERYYLPTLLPRASPKKNKTRFLCTVGNTGRRDFSLLPTYFLHNPTSIELQILGTGQFPKELQQYHKTIRHVQLNDFEDFHERVQRCSGILALLTKRSNVNYFAALPNTSTAQSAEKLSGILPIVIAYQIPVLLHEELAELYKSHLNHVYYETHTDDPESFVNAMKRFVDRIYKQ